MRLTVFLLLFSVIQVWGGNSYSQITKISLNLKDVTVQQVLNEIENQSEFYFLYSGKLVDVDRKIDINVKNKRIKDILNDLFTGEDVNCLVMNRQILLSPEYITERVDVTRDRQPQEIVVTGKVTDVDGNTLPGVNIVIKGTITGTITDVDGNYSIEVDDTDAVLVFSFVGFRTQEVPVGSQTTIDIVLEVDVIGLEEIVAIGYGTIRKSDLTGAVSSLRTDDFNKGVNSSFENLLQGKSSGVIINQSAGGEPGGGINIRIRGSNSVNASNLPLYVIDGVPIDNSVEVTGTLDGFINNRNVRNPLNAINPSDIESIEILKDASASAIYGSRGANGVIIITTKQGSKGKLTVSYDLYYGNQSVLKRLDLLNTDDYIKVLNELSMAESGTPLFSEDDIASIGKGTDWQNVIFRNAPVQNHQLSFSGGENNSSYYVSLNYFNQDGILANSGIEKFIGRINYSYSYANKFDFGINLNTSNVADELSPHGHSVNKDGGLIYAASLFDPTLPAEPDEDGNYAINPVLNLENPAALIAGMDGKSNTNRILGGFYANYFILDDWTVKLNIGTDIQTMRRDLYNGHLTQAGKGRGGIANVINTFRGNYLAELTSTYKKDFNDQRIEVLGGVTYQKFNNSFAQIIAEGFPTDVVQTNNVNLGDDERDQVSSNKNTNILLSYLFRVHYALKDKYLLSTSLRADGASRFGENNKFGYFPSASIAWRINKEPFLSNIKAISDFKLRVSWGQTGNQEIGNLNSISTYELATGYVWDGSYVVGVDPARIPNPDLKWETTEQTNIGFDYGFFNGRIFGTIDYYKKTTKDMLLNLPVPGSSGFSSMLENIGSIENSGFEFFLSTRNLTGALRWNTSLNITKHNNKVKDIGGIPEIITGHAAYIDQSVIVTPGEALYSYYGYEVTGIFQQSDDIAGSSQPNSQPGYPIYKDQNGDNQINSDDRVILGNPYPNVSFGITNVFYFKNFELNFFIQGVTGVELLNTNVFDSYYPISFSRNRLAEPYLNRWTPENPSNKYPSGVTPALYGGGEVNSMTVLDADFLCLKYVTLSYHIPLENNKILSSASIYITGQNLMLLSDYTGMNPEANEWGNSDIRMDINGYPIARTFLIGASISF